ncbi:FUSC family protein [Streptomyces sp. NPDC060333]|uniref:FUSC family protein n=1 Tax=Streptomyces sp. NPDC060333 TaxID=3347098 RepID=UPI0036486DB4
MAAPRPRFASTFGSTVRELRGVYLAREGSGRYDWHLAVAMALMVGAPVLVGTATGRTSEAVVVSLGAWFTSLAVPRATAADRVRQSAFRTILLTSTTAVGLLVGDLLWAVLLVSAVLCLLSPLTYVGVTPLITLVMAVGPQSVPDTAEHLLLFAGGSLWAGAILLVPFLGGAYAAPSAGPRPARRGARESLTALRGAAREGNPRLRYAVRICVCFTVAYAVLTWLDVPHAAWALVGILTTLRPSWGATRTRITKRLIGLCLGCVLTVVLLALTSGRPVAAAIVITVCGGIARPMRGWNYGFWPVFGTPVLILLTDTDAHVVWSDVLQRLTNNALGAVLAAVTVLFVWPAREERRLPERLQTLLESHARLLERVATVVEYGPPPARERRVRAAEAASLELRSALDRLSGPHLDVLAAVVAADRLRGAITPLRPYAISGLSAPDLRTAARSLDATAAGLTSLEFDATGRSATGAMDSARAAVGAGAA